MRRLSELFAITIFDLTTQLSVDECFRRLKDTTESEWSHAVKSINFLSSAPKKELVGSIRKTKFRLWRSASSNNLFQLFGKFVAEGTTVRLHCRYQMHPQGRVFLILWVVTLLGSGAHALFSGQAPKVTINVFFGPFGYHSDEYLSPEGFLIFPLLMILAVVATFALGRYMTRKDPQFLKEFLCKTLDAREASKAS